MFIIRAIDLAVSRPPPRRTPSNQLREISRSRGASPSTFSFVRAAWTYTCPALPCPAHPRNVYPPSRFSIGINDTAVYCIVQYGAGQTKPSKTVQVGSRGELFPRSALLMERERERGREGRSVHTITISFDQEVPKLFEVWAHLLTGLLGDWVAESRGWVRTCR